MRRCPVGMLKDIEPMYEVWGFVVGAVHHFLWKPLRVSNTVQVTSRLGRRSFGRTLL